MTLSNQLLQVQDGSEREQLTVLAWNMGWQNGRLDPGRVYRG
jgi:hypothetical protein